MWLIKERLVRIAPLSSTIILKKFYKICLGWAGRLLTECISSFLSEKHCLAKFSKVSSSNSFNFSWGAILMWRFSSFPSSSAINYPAILIKSWITLCVPKMWSIKNLKISYSSSCSLINYFSDSLSHGTMFELLVICWSLTSKSAEIVSTNSPGRSSKEIPLIVKVQACFSSSYPIWIIQSKSSYLTTIGLLASYWGSY